MNSNDLFPELFADPAAPRPRRKRYPTHSLPPVYSITIRSGGAVMLKHVHGERIIATVWQHGRGWVWRAFPGTRGLFGAHVRERDKVTYPRQCDAVDAIKAAIKRGRG